MFGNRNGIQEDWRPSAYEQQCLSQLDDAKIWASLKRDRPDETEWLPSDVVKLTFRFNVFVCFVAVSLIFVVIGLGSGMGFAQLISTESIGFGLGATTIISLAFGAYMAALYRRSWNRRATWLQQERNL